MKSVNHIIKLFGASAAIVASATAASAQVTSAGYFNDAYIYNYQLNPAMPDSATRNYVAMPGIGNVNVGMNGTLHVKDVLYVVNGRTTTFMNPAISPKTVMDNIGSSNRIGADVTIGILSGGFKAFNGYNTVAINLRTTVDTRVPREIFSLLKEGVTNKTYDIGDLGANAQAWGEVAFGHSHQITPQLRVGGAFKILIGGGYIDADFKQTKIELLENGYRITNDARMRASVKGLYYKTDYNKHTKRNYVSDLDIDGGGVDGFGAAIDLGAVYKINEDWEVSAAVTDLGVISWDNDVVASTGGLQSVNTDDYVFSVSKKDDNYVKDEWKKIRDKVSYLYELNNDGDQGSRTTMLGTTLRFAGKYTFPLYRQLNFGLLNTTRIMGNYTWTDFRLSANVAPVKCFSATANFGLGTFGPSFGWMLNVHPRFFNFFLASDYTPGKLAKQGLPLSSNASVSMGINFPF